MKKGVMLPLIVAIIAAVVYFVILNSARNQAYEDSKPVEVIVAARDLGERKRLIRADLRRISIPSMYVAKDAFIYNAEADFQKVMNAVTLIQIPRGNQITKGSISSISARAGLGSRVPTQYRGYVLPVDMSVAQLVKPDDRIDIILTFEGRLKSTGTEEPVALTVLQRVPVLGVGMNLGQGMDAEQLEAAAGADQEASAFSDMAVLSLAMDPRDAQYLALAQSMGTLTVIVRNQTDGALNAMQIATLSSVITR